MSTSPYAAAPEDKLAEISRLAEARLEAQLTVGIAADQRAMTLASFLATLSAGVITILTMQPTHPWPLIVLILGFGLAAAFAAFAARPVTWFLPGTLPSTWLQDIVDEDSLHNGRAAMVGFYDEMITDNEAAAKRSARLVRWAFVITLVTLLAAVTIALVVRG